VGAFEVFHELDSKDGRGVMESKQNCRVQKRQGNMP
jgi:hypothetical protein